MVEFVLIVGVPMLGAIATTILVHGVLLRNAPFYVGVLVAAVAALVIIFFGYNRLLYWSVEQGYSGGMVGDQTNVALGGIVAMIFGLPACLATSVLIWILRRKRTG